MEVRQMNCCAFNEIRDLAEHNGDSKEAMLDFCEQVSEQECEEFGKYSKVLNPGAFYVFTAVVNCPRHERGLLKNDYGRKFAAFIKLHKLGTVVDAPPRLNRKNEPDHLVKGWIWAPAKQNLVKWWKENK